MKKIILMLVMAAASITAASAQSAPYRDDRQNGMRQQQQMRSPEDRAARQTDKMARRLNLTDAQRQAVYDANLSRLKQMEPLKESAQGNRRDAKRIKYEYESALRQTLTSDQFSQYEAMRDEQRARRMQQRRGMDDAPRGGYEPEESMPQSR